LGCLFLRQYQGYDTERTGAVIKLPRLVRCEGAVTMSRCPHCHAEVPPGRNACDRCGAVLGTGATVPAITPQLEAELRLLLDEGKKIEAIKHFRDVTGAGLKEAKEAVDRLGGRSDSSLADDLAFAFELDELLARGLKIQAIKRYRERTGFGLKEAKDAVEAIEREQLRGAGPPEADQRFRAELVDLLRQGQKIEAIKRYRARTGVGLKAAKDAVEALGVVPVGSGRGGCLSGLLLVGLGAASLWVLDLAAALF
jgi:ribosomal protein L7/L12